MIGFPCVKWDIIKKPINKKKSGRSFDEKSEKEYQKVVLNFVQTFLFLIIVHDSQYVFHFDLPGYFQKDIVLSVKGLMQT